MKSGFVAIIGRPSTGKSTFLNSILNEKVSITSHIPQTTRKQIRGIYQGKNSQIVFLDTPGFHKSDKKFNTKLTEQVVRTLKEADAVLYFIDIMRPWGEEEDTIVDLLKNIKNSSIIVVVNKVDVYKRDGKTLQDAMCEIEKKLENISYKEILPISALEKLNMVSVISSVEELLPNGPQYYPEDYYTDQPFDFRITELIREKVFQFTKDEIPHSCFVDLEHFEETSDKKLLKLIVVIYVERESQKGIVVGKNGSLIKKIGIESRKDLEEIYGKKVFLDLKVKVKKKWRKDEKVLKKMFSNS